MSPPVRQPPLLMRLRRSRIGRGALLIVFLMALAAIGLADLPVHVRLGVSILAGVLTLQAWRAPQPLELKLHADGRLEWREAAASWRTASVLPRSTVSPWLCLLAYRAEGERRARHAAILPDSLERDDFRKLRVWLRWRAGVEGAGQAAEARRR